MEIHEKYMVGHPRRLKFNLFNHMLHELNLSCELHDEDMAIAEEQMLSYLTSGQQRNKYKVTANQIAHLLACVTVDRSPEK